jgi:hypothetical protein
MPQVQSRCAAVTPFVLQSFKERSHEVALYLRLAVHNGVGHRNDVQSAAKRHPGEAWPFTMLLVIITMRHAPLCAA